MSTTSNKWIKPAAIAAVVLGLAGAGAYVLTDKPVAPNVTFAAIQGQPFTTESLRGKVVMVNFWATSCTTCVHEMPKMIETYNQYKDRGLEFVAVAMSYDAPSYVANFTETRKLPFRVALDMNGSNAKAFGNVAMTPTTFVIGKDGKILKRYLGEPNFDEVHALLEQALKS